MLNVDLDHTNYETFANTPKLRKITLANLKDTNEGAWHQSPICACLIRIVLMFRT